MCATHAIASVLCLAAVAASLPVMLTPGSILTLDSKDFEDVAASRPRIQVSAVYPKNLNYVKALLKLPDDQVHSHAKPHKLTRNDLESAWHTYCKMAAEKAGQQVLPQDNYLRFKDESAKHIKAKKCKFSNGEDVTDQVWNEMKQAAAIRKAGH